MCGMLFKILKKNTKKLNKNFDSSSSFYMMSGRYRKTCTQEYLRA